MGNSSYEQVLAGARQCFFRHGYTASNMTLISQYAGYSRVTVHKHFKNKDDAFRVLCQQVVKEATDACQPILADTLLLPWDAIEAIMVVWLRPTFEEVNDEVVMRDLKFYVQEVADDLFLAAHEQVETMIEQRLSLGLEQGHIQLNRSQMTVMDMARLLVASADGIRGYIPHKSIEKACHDLVKVFRAATQIG